MPKKEKTESIIKRIENNMGVKEINPINIDTKGTNINYSGASRKLSGKEALKQTIKKIKKTPNKNFKQDKSYTLDIPSKRNPNQKNFQRIEGGKEQKQKAIQQQQDIYNKQKEDYRSPFKKGGLVKSGKPKIATKGWK
jgi:hypothetical protein